MSARPTRRALLGAILATTVLTGCIGAEDRSVVEEEAGLRGGGIDGPRLVEAHDALADLLAVPAEDVRLSNVRISSPRVTIDAATTATPRIWDGYVVESGSARQWTERQTNSIDGWFLLADVPALDRLEELVDLAEERSGVPAGTATPSMTISCDRLSLEDGALPGAGADGTPDIPRCTPQLRVSFSHDRESYDPVTFTADGEVQR